MFTVEVPQGWEVVEPGTPDDPEEPKQQTEAEKARSELIHRLAPTLFPPPEFDEEGVCLFPITVMGKQMYSEYDVNEYERDLVEVEYRLAETGVSAEDLPEFITNVQKLTAVFDSKEWKGASSINRDIRIAETADQAKEFVALLDFWQTVEHASVEKDILQPIAAEEKVKFFIDLTGTFQSPRKMKPELATSQEMIHITLEYHQVLQNVPAELPEKVPHKFKIGIERCLDNHDLASARELIGLLREVSTQQVEERQFENFADAVARYADHLSLSRKTAEYFRDYLFPAVASQDENVFIINRRSNSWAMKRGEFAFGEYACHLYSDVANPQLINELLLANSEIPTSVAHQFEQNRLDGLSLTRVWGLGQLKESIHDQMPHTHSVIQAMVDFYDGKIDADALTTIAQKNERVRKDERFFTVAVQPETYETMVEEKNSSGPAVKTIDILRRLAKNTAPIPDTLPVDSPYPELNSVLEEIGVVPDGTPVDRQLLEKALKTINTLLENMYEKKRVGISSKLITTISYLDRLAARTLRAIPFEEQVSLRRTGWFAEILRFHDLTATKGGYDAVQTAEFIRQVQQQHIEGAHQMIGQKVARDMNVLSKDYKVRSLGRWSGMLDSGNLTRELLFLLDLHEPTTPTGVKYKQRFLAVEAERLKGD